MTGIQSLIFATEEKAATRLVTRHSKCRTDVKRVTKIFHLASKGVQASGAVKLNLRMEVNQRFRTPPSTTNS